MHGRDAIHAAGPEAAAAGTRPHFRAHRQEAAHRSAGAHQLNNVNAFFGYGEEQDFKDARRQIAVVDQGGLGLPERDYYFRTGDAAEKTRKEYVAHIADMLGLMGEPADKASADAEKIMTLETALAKVSLDITSRATRIMSITP